MLGVSGTGKTTLARALAAGPRILVCDESTSALDSDTERDVLTVLEKARRDLGLAVLLITHSLDVAAGADRVVTVADSRIAATPDVQGAPSPPPSHLAWMRHDHKESR